MAGMSVTSSMKIGGSLAQLVEVIECTATESRDVVELPRAKLLSATNYYGTWRASGSVSLVFDKADQTLIEDQIAAAGASIAVSITWLSGAVWSGSAKFSDFAITFSNGQYVQATANWTSDGPWSINGRNTETLVTS